MKLLNCPPSASAFSVDPSPANAVARSRAGERGDVALQGGIEQSLYSLGFRGENRPFTPHLTLGRGHGGQPLTDELEKLAEYDGGMMLVDQVIVYASELSRDGPTYHVWPTPRSTKSRLAPRALGRRFQLRRVGVFARMLANQPIEHRLRFVEALAHFFAAIEFDQQLARNSQGHPEISLMLRRRCLTVPQLA